MRQNIIMTCLLTVAIALGVAACGQDEGPFSPLGQVTTIGDAQGPLGPTDLSSNPGGDIAFAKKTGGSNGGKGGGPKDGGDTQTEATYAEKSIGKNGGFLSITNAKLLIPKNALTSRTRISMENVGAIEGALWAYEFTPGGLVFDKPAELWVDVSLEFLEANGIDPGRLRIALVTGPDPANWQYLNGRYQPAYQHINVQIEHFSRYALCIE